VLLLLAGLSGAPPSANGTPIGLLLLLTRIAEAIAPQGPSPEARYIIGRSYQGHVTGDVHFGRIIGQAKFPERRPA
jgi:hypothetical protein